MNSTKLLLLAALLASSSCASRHRLVPKDEGVEEKLSEASILRGKVLYEENCLSCHGKDGLGNGPLAHYNERRPADLRELVRKTRNFSFFVSISQWQGDMPGWKREFNEVDREDLVAYLKTFR